MAPKTLFAGAALILLLASPAAATPPDGLVPDGATRLRDANGVTDFDIAMQPSDIVAFYRKALTAQGYSLTDDVDTPASIRFFFNRGDSASGSVLIRQGIDGMHVTLTMNS